MSEKAFSKIMRGLEEAMACMEGKRNDDKITVPPSVDVKSIRKGLNVRSLMAPGQNEACGDCGQTTSVSD